jgi:DNA-binding HxlR family transcriptional regulator
MAKPSIRLPLPGTPVRGSRTGRPVMALLDLLGRRWALRVLWELREEPAATFRDLQMRCGSVSSSVLNQRLRELRGGGIIATGHPTGYELTDEGRTLLQALAPIDDWATQWGRRQSAPRSGEPNL